MPSATALAPQTLPTALTHLNPNPESPPRPQKLHFFGLVLSHLPPVGTPPSTVNPIVSPVPVTLGIDRTTKDVIAIDLIHAARTSPLDPTRGPVLIHISRLANLENGNFTFCITESLSTMLLECLLGMEDQKFIKRRDKGGYQWDITLDVTQLSRRCAGCGRWEALVRNQGDPAITWRYRRWKLCMGCKEQWFCRVECQKAAWDRGHWADCIATENLWEELEKREALMAQGNDRDKVMENDAESIAGSTATV